MTGNILHALKTYRPRPVTLQHVYHWARQGLMMLLLAVVIMAMHMMFWPTPIIAE